MSVDSEWLAAKMLILLRKSLTLKKFTAFIYEHDTDADTNAVVEMVFDCVCMVAFEKEYSELSGEEWDIVHEAMDRARRNAQKAYEQVCVTSFVGEA